jgi:hypothetical protein
MSQGEIIKISRIEKLIVRCGRSRINRALRPVTAGRVLTLGFASWEAGKGSWVSLDADCPRASSKLYLRCSCVTYIAWNFNGLASRRALSVRPPSGLAGRCEPFAHGWAEPRNGRSLALGRGSGGCSSPFHQAPLEAILHLTDQQ